MSPVGVQSVTGAASDSTGNRPARSGTSVARSAALSVCAAPPHCAIRCSRRDEGCISCGKDDGMVLRWARCVDDDDDDGGGGGGGDDDDDDDDGDGEDALSMMATCCR
eukprot:726095-Rhodomonas_salina.2